MECVRSVGRITAEECVRDTGKMTHAPPPPFTRDLLSIISVIQKKLFNFHPFTVLRNTKHEMESVSRSLTTVNSSTVVR